MTNLNQFLVDKLDASLAGNLQELDLRFDQKIESKFGNKETRSRSS